MRNLIQKINGLISRALIAGVHGYQHTLGHILGGHCRFYPSCSNYFIGAVQKYGPWRGTLKGVWRILRCHPFSKGGIDPY
jgi:putative membrane protein insertion efficiency factor